MIEGLKHKYQFEQEVYIIKKDSPGERTDDRSSHSQMFFKIGFLKKFVNYTGKHLRWSLLFIKVGGMKPFYPQKQSSGFFLWKRCS